MNKNTNSRIQPVGRGLQTPALEAAILPALSPSPIPRASSAPRAGPQLQPRRSGQRSGGADSQADSAAGVQPAHASAGQRGAGRAARPAEVGAWRRPRRSRSGGGPGAGPAAGAALQDPDLCGAGHPALPGAVATLEARPGRTTTPHGATQARDTPSAHGRRAGGRPPLRRSRGARPGGGAAPRRPRPPDHTPRSRPSPPGPAPAALLAAFPPGLLGARQGPRQGGQGILPGTFDLALRLRFVSGFVTRL